MNRRPMSMIVDTHRASNEDDSMDLTAIARAASDVEPATGLRAVVALRRLTDELERQQVQRARAAGWSWQQIGDALGISRQAAHKKHRR